jgi:hypothetical protein
LAADRSDDADVPSGEHSDHAADRANPPADDTRQSARPPAETRTRQEAYDHLYAITQPNDRTDPADRSGPVAPSQPADHPANRPEAPADESKRSDHPPSASRSDKEPPTDLRAPNESQEHTEPAVQPEPAAHSNPAEPTESRPQPPPGTTWEERTDLYRWMWNEYKNKWQDKERPPVDTSEDLPGTWRGDGDRKLGPADNERIEAECDRIAERAEKEITPAVLAVERQDPDRHLIGLEHCLKDRDRIKEKVSDNMNEYGLPAAAAISLVPDTIRYTFQYKEVDYARGVSADIARLHEQGFKLEIPKNFWSDDQYKGVNSQWIEPVSGQRFEVQFHTRISYEAKQLTHPAYERIRTKQADALEDLLLEAFQKKVSAAVPIPPGAMEIRDYSKRDQDAR